MTRDETAWTWWTLAPVISGRLAQKYRRRTGVRAGPARTRTHAGLRFGGAPVRTETVSECGLCAEPIPADSVSANKCADGLSAAHIMSCCGYAVAAMPSSRQKCETGEREEPCDYIDHVRDFVVPDGSMAP